MAQTNNSNNRHCKGVRSWFHYAWKRSMVNGQNTLYAQACLALCLSPAAAATDSGRFRCWWRVILPPTRGVLWWCPPPLRKLLRRWYPTRYARRHACAFSTTTTVFQQGISPLAGASRKAQRAQHPLLCQFNTELLHCVCAAWLHAMRSIQDEARVTGRRLYGAHVYSAFPFLPQAPPLAHALTMQLHTEAAQQSLWLLGGGGWGGVGDGCFVAPGASGIGPLALEFVQQHLPIFDVPWDVVTSLQAAGVQGIKEVCWCASSKEEKMMMLMMFTSRFFAFLCVSVCVSPPFFPTQVTPASVRPLLSKCFRNRDAWQACTPLQATQLLAYALGDALLDATDEAAPPAAGPQGAPASDAATLAAIAQGLGLPPSVVGVAASNMQGLLNDADEWMQRMLLGGEVCIYVFPPRSLCVDGMYRF